MEAKYVRFKIKIHNSETQLSKNFFRFYFVLIVTTLQSTDEVPSEAAVMQDSNKKISRIRTLLMKT